jgi:aspartate aminotransferase
MPGISLKGKNMPASPIRKLVPYADQAKAKGIKVYHLNIGQPDIKTPENVMKAIKEIDLDLIAYSPSQGYQSYRKKLAGYYQQNHIPVTESDILVTTGGSEALSIAIGSIADPGDEIIIPEPFYANYNGFAKQNAVNVVPIHSSIESNFALPPIEDFEKLITPKTKAILYSNPGNPTGYVYSKDEISKLRDLALKHDIYIIADEVYREFIYGDTTHHSILQEPDMENHAIIIDSVSKRYSMCGARIGTLITKNKKLMDTAMKFAQARLSPPTLGQIAAEAAIDTPQTYFDEVISEYKQRRDLLVDKLKEIPGIKVAEPKGAFYIIAELPVDDTDHFAQWLLENFNLEGETVMVAPAAGFYSTSGQGKKQIRIAYVLNLKDLEKAAHILKEGIKAYNKIYA